MSGSTAWSSSRHVPPDRPAACQPVPGLWHWHSHPTCTAPALCSRAGLAAAAPVCLGPCAADEQFSAASSLWPSLSPERAAQVWDQTFHHELGPPPKELHAPCCAEFVVSDQRILAHPLSFYVHLRDWIVHTELDSYRSGRGAVAAPQASSPVCWLGQHSRATVCLPCCCTVCAALCCRQACTDPSSCAVQCLSTCGTTSWCAAASVVVPRPLCCGHAGARLHPAGLSVGACQLLPHVRHASLVRQGALQARAEGASVELLVCRGSPP